GGNRPRERDVDRRVAFGVGAHVERAGRGPDCAARGGGGKFEVERRRRRVVERAGDVCAAFNGRCARELWRASGARRRKRDLDEEASTHKWCTVGWRTESGRCWEVGRESASGGKNGRRC